MGGSATASVQESQKTTFESFQLSNPRAKGELAFFGWMHVHIKVKVERDGEKAKAAAYQNDAEYQQEETGTMQTFSGRQTCTIERLVKLATELGGDPAAIKAAARVW